MIDWFEDLKAEIDYFLDNATDEELQKALNNSDYDYYKHKRRYKMNDEYGINTRLSLKAKKTGCMCGQQINLLALDGEIIPGQTSIWEVEPTDRYGVKKIAVIFELYDNNEE